MSLLSVSAMPSSLLSHLARRDNYWKTKRRPPLPCQRPKDYLNHARPLWTDNNNNNTNNSYHLCDLYNFKNGRNLSVADYLNIESK